MGAAEKTKTQERLEAIFHAVDLLKSDLATCYAIEVAPLNNGLTVENFPAYKKVSYTFDRNRGQLVRREKGEPERVLLQGVSDFYATFFPDAATVLYRIEIEGKEQIRGYIFLQNIKKEVK